MSIVELIALVESTKVDADEIQELNNRLDEAEKEFEEKARQRYADNDFLSARSYSL